MTHYPGMTLKKEDHYSPADLVSFISNNRFVDKMLSSMVEIASYLIVMTSQNIIMSMYLESNNNLPN